MYGAAEQNHLTAYPPRTYSPFQTKALPPISFLQSYGPPRENLKEQYGFSFHQSREDLQSAVRYHAFNGQNHDLLSYERMNLHPQSSLCKDAVLSSKQRIITFKDCCNYKVSSNSSRQQDKERHPLYSPYNRDAVVSSKPRIRWTQDLHSKFIECIDNLGGADKATPKGILQLMGVEGLTIFHIKSHLQKYRITRHISESKEEAGRLEKPTDLNSTGVLNLKTGKQIAESLQMQLDVQMRLHEQLQIQKDLQLKIEEQGRQLKLMLERRLKRQKKDVLLIT